MIKVNLLNPPFDFKLDQIFAKKLVSELDNNEKEFLNKDKKKYIFTVYKDDRIKSALINNFYGKCAFCDSTLRHISYGDIEHFRPKSIYWWLAADWKNFLLACPRCNQHKGNKFPLLNKKIFVNYKTHKSFDDVETAENPYRQLLNPLLDDPEKYIIYEEVKEPVIKFTANNILNKSIEVYDLNRIELVQERLKVKLLVMNQINRTKLALNTFNSVNDWPDTLQGKARNQFFIELDLLIAFLQPNQQYLGLCRQLIIPFLREYGLKVTF